MLAQGIHAAILFTKEHCEISDEWHRDSDYVAVLETKNESELSFLADKAASMGIKYSVFREADMDNQITAVAFEPGEASKRLLRKLSLAMS
jgi:peptidyl-tRNA hydrolase